MVDKALDDIIRDILQSAIESNLVRPGEKPSPQDYSAGELAAPSLHLANWLKDREQRALDALVNAVAEDVTSFLWSFDTAPGKQIN